MKIFSLSQLSLRLRALAIFRSLRDDPVLRAIDDGLEKLPSSTDGEAISACAAIAAALYRAGACNLTAYVRDLMYDDENPYVRCVAAGKTPPAPLMKSVEQELQTLQAVAALTPEQLQSAREWKTGTPDFLPGWETDVTAAEALCEGYYERMRQIGKYGYGMYARYVMFRLDGTGEIVPVHSPDPVQLGDLVGYAREKQVILDNTRALLAGKPAANMLLTGDAGTGKSSTVKATVNALAGEGLRILELRKEQLRFLPKVMGALRSNPLRFILFIDDLSFAKDDDNFSALKAMLEGSVSAKSRNVVIYATSNRRHLVKERFSDRDGDDVHRNDTMQEIVSLSERFGIRLTFARPDKATYLEIVRRLAEAEGLSFEEETLFAAAERFALSRASRSPRAARQFVDGLLAGTEE